MSLWKSRFLKRRDKKMLWSLSGHSQRAELLKKDHKASHSTASVMCLMQNWLPTIDQELLNKYSRLLSVCRERAG